MDKLLEQIVQRVDTDAVAHRMVESFTDEIDSYRQLPGQQLEHEIVAISRHNLELFFGALTDGRPVTADELRPFQDSARRRATEGLPLEDLLSAYRLGGRLGWETLVAAATPEEQNALLPCVARLMEYVDRVSDAVTAAYHEERRHLVSDEERRLRALMDALLAGATLDDDLRNLAQSLGLELVDRYRPFAIALSNGPPHAQSQLAAALRQQGRLALSDNGRLVGIAPASADPPPVDSDGIVVFGEPARPGTLGAALEDALLLLELSGRAQVTGVVAVREHLPELLLARSPQLAATLERCALGPLEEYAERRSADLLDTLEVFMRSDLDRRTAAEQLHVHPNTLDYRLRRVEELTGLSVSRPDDLALVSLALKQRALRARSRTGEGDGDL